MVILARESRGLSQRELAERLEMDNARLSRIEAGLKEFLPDQAQRLSQVLDYPPAFFVQNEVRQGMGASEFYHRKRASLAGRVLNEIHARIDIYRIGVERLLQGAIGEKARAIPTLDVDDCGGPEEVARLVRSTWFLPRGPVAHLTRLIEDAGGFVIRMDFKTPLLDAVSRALPGLPPLFFMNRDIPADRYRFSLAHELGHVVMHSLPNPEMESQANAFAAELMMPAEDIRPDLMNISLPRLAALKAVWKMSMAALLKRAMDLGAITDRQYRFLWMRMGQAGYKHREPVETSLPQETPRLLDELLDVYRSDMSYRDEDLQAFLRLNPPDFEQLYTGGPKGLRVLR